MTNGTKLTRICKLSCFLPSSKEQCHTYLTPVQIGWQWWELVIHIVSNIVHEPFKILASKPLFQSQLLTNVPHVQVPCKGFPCIEVLFEFVIKPCFYNSFVVLKIMNKFLFFYLFTFLLLHHAF